MAEIDLSDEIKTTLLYNSPEFETWNLDDMEGKRRVLIFTQKTLLGEISRFNCYDVVIWKYSYPKHVDLIKRKWKGNMNSFLTRFVFLHPTADYSYLRMPLWWGLKGYLDVIICPFPWRGTVVEESITDLLPLLNSTF
ncbi:MAG: hypothetical protein N3G21_05065 [Candidatus Hydrogenedentes bacterium]|nr:hypothetical protein [Candidatus Hydrogenedentota bacterium]